MLELQPGQRKLPLKAIFRKLDADDSGHLDRKEIRHLMECMGRILSNEQFEEAWNGMDTDGSGECGFDEFETWFYRTQAAPRRAGSKQQLRRTKQDLRRTFKDSIKKAGILAMGGYRAMRGRGNVDPVVDRGQAAGAKAHRRPRAALPAAW